MQKLLTQQVTAHWHHTHFWRCRVGFILSGLKGYSNVHDQNKGSKQSNITE